ncbi:hypothetical protein ACTFIW_002873 [Dictyostelium discoideum]
MNQSETDLKMFEKNNLKESVESESEQQQSLSIQELFLRRKLLKMLQDSKNQQFIINNHLETKTQEEFNNQQITFPPQKQYQKQFFNLKLLSNQTNLLTLTSAKSKSTQSPCASPPPQSPSPSPSPPQSLSPSPPPSLPPSLLENNYSPLYEDQTKQQIEMINEINENKTSFNRGIKRLFTIEYNEKCSYVLILSENTWKIILDQSRRISIQLKFYYKQTENDFKYDSTDYDLSINDYYFENHENEKKVKSHSPFEQLSIEKPIDITDLILDYNGLCFSHPGASVPPDLESLIIVCEHQKNNNKKKINFQNSQKSNSNNNNSNRNCGAREIKE